MGKLKDRSIMRNNKNDMELDTKTVRLRSPSRWFTVVSYMIL